MKKFLFVIPFFALLFCHNSFALQHNYDGIYTSDIYGPPIHKDSDNNYFYDFNSSDYSVNYGVAMPLPNSLWVELTSDSDTPSFYSTPYHYFYTGSSGVLDNLSFSNSLCTVNPSSNKFSFMPDFQYNSSSHRLYLNTFPYSLSGDFLSPCFRNGTNITYNRTPGVSYISYEPIDLSQRIQYGFPYGVSDNSLGNSTGLNLSQSKVTETSGIIYTSNFSFSRVVKNSDITSFSKLSIPLFSSDGFFLKSENLYSGRELLWRFSFNFPSGFQYTSDAVSSGSIKLILSNARIKESNVSVTPEYTCTSETIGIGDSSGESVLDITCPVTLNANYSGFFPQLLLSSGTSSAIFNTSGEWFFSGAYLVTDNNYSQGESFNQGMSGLWDMDNGRPTGESDISWFDSLSNLFRFGIPFENTPMGAILGNFVDVPNTDSFDEYEGCAYIPIIASMIYSMENHVCPWFDARTRSIGTSVLSIFSVCLIFGFLIHWLRDDGGGTANLIEADSGHASSNRSNTRFNPYRASLYRSRGAKAIRASKIRRRK